MFSQIIAILKEHEALRSRDLAKLLDMDIESLFKTLNGLKEHEQDMISLTRVGKNDIFSLSYKCRNMNKKEVTNLNTSINYIKQLIKDYPDRVSDDIKTVNWDKVNIINLMDYIENNIPRLTIKDNTVSVRIVNNTTNKFANVNLKYNPNAEFDYFTTDMSTHDGTLLFVGQAIERILNRILTVQTQYVKSIPKGFNENNFFQHDYFYEVGDILLHSDVGMKNINGNNVMGERDIMILPIKFSMIRRCYF